MWGFWSGLIVSGMHGAIDGVATLDQVEPIGSRLPEAWLLPAAGGIATN